MSLEVAWSVSRATIALPRGPFDAAVVAEIRPLVEEVILSGEHDLYLDIGQVALLDSAAIGLFAYAFKRLVAKGRRVVIVNAGGQARTMLSLLRIDRVITVGGALPDDAPTCSATPPARPAGAHGETAPPAAGQAA